MNRKIPSLVVARASWASTNENSIKNLSDSFNHLQNGFRARGSGRMLPRHQQRICWELMRHGRWRRERLTIVKYLSSKKRVKETPGVIDFWMTRQLLRQTLRVHFQRCFHFENCTTERKKKTFLISRTEPFVIYGVLITRLNSWRASFSPGVRRPNVKECKINEVGDHWGHCWVAHRKKKERQRNDSRRINKIS